MEKGNENDRIWSLMMKCISGECSGAEQKELKVWKSMASENMALFYEVNNLLINVNDAMNIRDINEELAWHKVHSRIQQDNQENLSSVSRVRRLNIIWRVAASVVLAVFIALGYYLWKNNAARPNILTAGSSEIRNVILPDGSKVVVNGGSVFKYPSAFKGKERKVSLSGEAYFEVTGNKEHPFVVVTDKLTIRVVGTSFNVKTCGGTSRATVVVESGVVRVMAGKSSVTVKKGEAALFDRNDGTLKRYANTDLNVNAWRTKQIRFVNTPLKEALETIENVYKVDIEIPDSSLVRDKRLDANFDKHSLDFVLNTICETYHLNYEHKGSKYVITE